MQELLVPSMQATWSVPEYGARSSRCWGLRDDKKSKVCRTLCRHPSACMLHAPRVCARPSLFLLGWLPLL